LEDGRLLAFGLLISYLKNTQKKNLNNIVRISLHNQESQVLLDEITTKNLEIFNSSYEQSEKYSLI
jgi:DNA mismatch repair ATPase MutS